MFLPLNPIVIEAFDRCPSTDYSNQIPDVRVDGYGRMIKRSEFNKFDSPFGWVVRKINDLYVAWNVKTLHLDKQIDAESFATSDDEFVFSDPSQTCVS